MHGGARPAGIVEVGVAVDERGVENLDEFERNFEAGGNHRDVEQQEAQREHQREVRNGGLQIPARVAAVQRQSDGGQHEDQKDLRGTRSAARYLQTDDDDGENAGHRIADRDFLLRRVFVLAEFRLVSRVNHRAEAATQRDDAHSRELGELQLRHLQKQVLRGETRVRRSIDAQSARYAARKPLPRVELIDVRVWMAAEHFQRERAEGLLDLVDAFALQSRVELRGNLADLQVRLAVDIARLGRDKSGITKHTRIKQSPFGPLEYKRTTSHGSSSFSSMLPLRDRGARPDTPTLRGNGFQDMYMISPTCKLIEGTSTSLPPFKTLTK